MIHYQLPEEGEIVSHHEARLSEFALDGLGEKIEFAQGDAHNLKPQFTGYDLILAGNLLDRLYDPNRFLTTIHERMTPGGLLIIASPYTWLEEFTRKEYWIGGIRRAGEPFTTFEGLKETLAGHFSLLGKPLEVEFVLRETARKFQHTISQVTIWKRTS